MNIKKVLVLVVITFFFSFIIYKMYKSNKVNYIDAYILQIGAYKNYENVAKKTKLLDNYIIYEEDNLYKIFIGVTTSDEVYDKIKKIYAKDDNIFKKIIKIKDDDFEHALKKYDEVILKENNKEDINLIIKSSLNGLEKILSNQKI